MKKTVKASFLLVLVSILLSHFLSAQNLFPLDSSHADCKNAISIPPYEWGPTTAPVGAGKKMEISGDFRSLTAFHKEHNTVWYRFQIDKTCDVSFDIIPLNPADDYDFILYKVNVPNICEAIAKNTAKPIRACISRNDKSIGSKTGLQPGKEKKFVHSGPGESYLAPIQAKAGEEYILVLDNVYQNGDGHSIHFHYSNCREELRIPIQVKSPMAELEILVMDNETSLPLTANISVEKLENKQLMKKDSLSLWSIPSPLGEKYRVSVIAKGYLFQEKEIEIQSAKEKLVFDMEKMAEGKSISFNNILFHGNQAIFLKESYNELNFLLQMMLDNPSLEIEIQGHVNCPLYSCKKEDAEWNQRLSDARAKAVYSFLVDYGVEENRMHWKGYSSDKMIYPYAKTEEEMKKNRRVEIKIIHF